MRGRAGLLTDLTLTLTLIAGLEGSGLLADHDHELHNGVGSLLLVSDVGFVGGRGRRYAWGVGLVSVYVCAGGAPLMCAFRECAWSMCA